MPRSKSHRSFSAGSSPSHRSSPTVRRRHGTEIPIQPSRGGLRLRVTFRAHPASRPKTRTLNSPALGAMGRRFRAACFSSFCQPEGAPLAGADLDRRARCRIAAGAGSVGGAMFPNTPRSGRPEAERRRCHAVGGEGATAGLAGNIASRFHEVPSCAATSNCLIVANLDARSAAIAGVSHQASSWSLSKSARRSAIFCLVCSRSILSRWVRIS